ncbi:MAG TPA: alpha-L-rhamnosidase N-terminal domain-containing protein, partial [Candidatus Didemnitutus sp.]|nr:alpha-L-rhamnosidase N-terminal domain-containing protein [Candidatus Didemnitutus sp.]
MKHPLLPFLTAVVLFPVALFAAPLGVDGLRCEGVNEPGQIETAAPRFSWRLVAQERDIRQVAYQFHAAEIDGNGHELGTVFETARIATEESQWVTPPGFQAKPRSAYAWRVRVWDNHGAASDWSAPQTFGTGLIGTPWPADWVGDGRSLERFQTAPARYFRGGFKLDHRPVRARLYVSAMGLVEPWLNGSQVTRDLFLPGWPDYRRRLFYAAYDITALLRDGENTLGLILGDGWYSGTMIPRHQYGPEATCSAF